MGVGTESHFDGVPAITSFSCIFDWVDKDYNCADALFLVLGIGWKLEGKGAVLVQAFICITLVGGFVDICVSTTDDVAGLNSKKKKKRGRGSPPPPS